MNKENAKIAWDQLGSSEQESIRAMLTGKYWFKRLGGVLFIVTIAGMAGCPQYKVWVQGLEGKAELARAEYNRQVKMAEAQAKVNAATDLAEAERIRAEGVADANTIIADGLGGPEGYLRYLFIDSLSDENSNCDIRYIPTEANLPILEARTESKK